MGELKKNEQKSRISVKSMAMVAVMTALFCVLGPLSIPLPISPVPISLQNFVIYLSLYVLGMKWGTVSYIVYLLLGLVGLPVLSGYTGGPGKLFGPTGGYLIGFIALSVVGGFFVDRFRKNYLLQIVGMVVGTLICYIAGTLWLAYQASLSFSAALWAGVIPFIPGDLVKMVLALLIGVQVRKALIRSGIRRMKD